METQDKIKIGANSAFAIGVVSCFADTFVVAKSFVLRISISAEQLAHRKFVNFRT